MRSPGLSAQNGDIAVDCRSGRNTFLSTSMSYRGFISERHRYFFLSIPKAGATTTKKILWELEGFGNLPRDYHERPKNDPRLSPLTAPQSVTHAAFHSPDYVRFTLWRDPVERIVSAYRNKIATPANAAQKWMSAEVRRIADAIGRGSPAEITLDEFVEFICSVPDEDRNPHWMSQRRLAFIGRVNYDFIVRLDRYAEDMTKVLDAIGVRSDARPDLNQRLNVSVKTNADQLSKRAEMLIRDAFAGDFDIVG